MGNNETLLYFITSIITELLPDWDTYIGKL